MVLLKDTDDEKTNWKFILYL